VTCPRLPGYPPVAGLRSPAARVSFLRDGRHPPCIAAASVRSDAC
jgi:hypothetical protein